MDFSALVLMEKDKETNFLTKELGSYEVSEGASYITKFYYDGEAVNLIFDTIRDVEEWEYSAIFDLFDEEAFRREGLEIDTMDDEYNPTWLVKFSYDEDYSVMQDKINTVCSIIEDKMSQVFHDIEGKEQDYI